MKLKAKLGAQISIVLLCALGLKHHYSTASPDQLRWILAPTTRLVELLSGQTFTFESHAGYMSSDHSFLIAASCAGVNFLITAFLMLTLRSLWSNRSGSLVWHFIPMAGIIAYLATICANTVRIWIALESRPFSRQIDWLSASQTHRLEGIIVYFGFLLILFLLTEKTKHQGVADLCRQLRFPLLVYYVTTLGMPLANGAFKQRGFWEHSLFVMLVPGLLIVFVLALRVFVSGRKREEFSASADSGFEHISDCGFSATRAKVSS
jgi:exosortase K